MPAFGCNEITRRFALRVKNEPVKGFRLSDRIVSAIDRFVGALSRFMVDGEPGVMNRWLYIYPFVGGKDWTHALNLADAPNSGYQGGAGPAVSLTAPLGNFERFKITWSGTVTHDGNGVTFGSGGSGNTHIDCADATNYVNAWNRKSHGLYSRTNSAVNTRDMSAAFTEPRNGYTYWQGIHPRWGDGVYYGDLVRHSKSGTPDGGNRNQVAVGDSLGLFIDSQRGPVIAPPHYMFKRGAYMVGDNTGEVGMGYGDVGSGAWMTFSGTRNWAFAFSTRYSRTLQGTKNSDGSGGVLPGTDPELNIFVEQLQVALQRNV